ncbi:MAG: class I SAM-dependent methyltransferase [Alphaproteobacteria bacterium]
MTDLEVLNWLEEEYEHPFEGWDFSYLKGRRTALGSLPWDYKTTVENYLITASSLLDIDTGGGEVLADLLRSSAFSGRACAVEAHRPNVPVARKTLMVLGVEVHDTSCAPTQFADGTFDLVIDRHGGSISPSEVFRVLKSGGHYITEQIGDRTNAELRAAFGASPMTRPDWPHNASDASDVFQEIGFDIEALEEHSFPIRFVDAGAVVYYLKAVPWEVPEFTIRQNAEALIQLHEFSRDRGYAIDATYHAYLLIARKP